ncbi:MAG TPA: hypothetical protein P5514_10545 [Bacteroidales bacterium]|nr:hypothetical protein [Bacteroidales bacterium]
MKTWHKILIIMFILGTIGAALGYKFVYNKPHPDYLSLKPDRDFEKATPDFQITALDLFSAYRNDKKSAELKFNGKVVEIAGLISKVEEADSLTIAVFVMDQGMFGDEGIRCTMLPNHTRAIEALTGSEITIKGFVSGYNDTDVIFEKCSLIK